MFWKVILLRRLPHFSVSWGRLLSVFLVLKSPKTHNQKQEKIIKQRTDKTNKWIYNNNKKKKQWPAIVISWGGWYWDLKRGCHRPSWFHQPRCAFFLKDLNEYLTKYLSSHTFWWCKGCPLLFFMHSKGIKLTNQYFPSIYQVSKIDLLASGSITSKKKSKSLIALLFIFSPVPVISSLRSSKISWKVSNQQISFLMLYL